MNDMGEIGHKTQHNPDYTFMNVIDTCAEVYLENTDKMSSTICSFKSIF